MQETRSINRIRRVVISVCLAAVIIYVLYVMPLPFYIFSAGTAEATYPMVQAKQSGNPDKGVFMLTTVRAKDATIFRYLLTLVRPYDELRMKTELLRKDETEQEYSQRQEVNMRSSQSSALQAAYHKLGIPYKVVNDGVVIVQVIKNVPANEVLQAGDYIVKVDDTPIEQSQELQKLLQSKQAGDTVAVSYKRKQITRVVQIKLDALPAAEGAQAAKPEERRVGLGVVPVTMQSIKAEDEAKQVNINAGEIGGPSAGLMFSLEIMNRLLPEDIAKGYTIAGTGTIDDQGAVGAIGGIQHKIMAADKAGADIFFAPKDHNSQVKGSSSTNYSDALKRAEEIASRMKIVPVGTLDDAINYLNTLPPKPAAQ